MKFNYYGQTVDLFSKDHYPDGPPERVVVNVSGGLDSAALLCLLVEYFPQVQKHIFTGDDITHPMDAARAKVVVRYFKNRISDHNIKSHDVIPYDDRDPKLLEEVEQLVEKDPAYFDKYSKHLPKTFWNRKNTEKVQREYLLSKISKPLINEKNIKKVMKKYECSRFISGMTQNPPNKVMDELGFAHLAETKRNEDKEDVKIFNPDGKAYQPFARVNKLFVKGVFENHHRMMEDLYNVTGSCTGTEKHTKYWTKPCEKCFWCYEKKWAFGQF